jgi:hypothetical protein
MYGGTTYPVPWPNVSMGASLDYSYYQPDNLAFVGNGEWQACRYTVPRTTMA